MTVSRRTFLWTGSAGGAGLLIGLMGIFWIGRKAIGLI